MLLYDKDQLNIVLLAIVEDQHATSEVQDGFQFPGWIWSGMLASYALFFIAITAATGRSGSALFAIVISIGYTVMFFAVATVIGGVKGWERRSPLARKNGILPTWTGRVNAQAVAAQVLIVPVGVALFAIGILFVFA